MLSNLQLMICTDHKQMYTVYNIEIHSEARNFSGGLRHSSQSVNYVNHLQIANTERTQTLHHSEISNSFCQSIETVLDLTCNVLRSLHSCPCKNSEQTESTNLLSSIRRLSCRTNGCLPTEETGRHRESQLTRNRKHCQSQN